MKTKRAYTQFRPLLAKMRKILNLHGVSPRELWATIKDAYGKQPLVGNDLSLWTMENMEELIIKGDCTHVFLPSKEFCEWLVSCVGAISLDHCEAVVERFKDCLLVLNFPTEARLNSFAVGAAMENKPPCIVIDPSFEHIGQVGADVWSIEVKNQSPENLSEYLLNIRTDGIGGKEPNYDFPKWAAKLFVGIGMYCSCFPEVVKDGLPDDLKHPAHHQYETVKTIGISHQITLSGTHDSPVAHFRRGHFRVLRSDKFKHKRFQAVFVRETFVNGKAKTVLAPEEVTA